MSDLVKKNILGVGITDASREKILEYVENGIGQKKDPFYIVTPNPEIIVHAARHEGLRKILSGARISLCDGVGIVWAGRILGKPLKERFTGVDFIEEICKRSVRKPVSIGFLGGRDGVAERAAECLVEKYGKLNVVFIGEEWGEAGFELASKRFPQMVADDHGSAKISHNPRESLNFLFVALGFPKQEEWMAKHVDKGVYTVAIGVGGAFDYISGNVPRAPKFVRNLGLEWLYRLVRQPWRWKRQLALIEFMWMVLRERFMIHDS